MLSLLKIKCIFYKISSEFEGNLKNGGGIIGSNGVVKGVYFIWTPLSLLYLIENYLFFIH